MSYSKPKKIYIVLLCLIVILSSVSLLIINNEKVYAENYTYNLYCDSENGSVNISRNENTLTFNFSQKENYAYSIKIYKKNSSKIVENLLYFYDYEYVTDSEFTKTELKYTLTEDVDIYVTFTITYLIRFYRYRDEDTGENIDLLVEYRYREGTELSYAGSTPTRDSEFGITYTFKRWEPEVTSSDVVTKDQDYYGVYDTNEIFHTIIFQNDDGTIISSKKYRPGEKIEVPEAPTKASTNQYDYYFDGWDNPVDENAFFSKMYTATYRAVSRFHAISTMAEHGSIVLDKVQDTYEYGTIININTIPDKGYVLSGLYLINSLGKTKIENNSIVVTEQSEIVAEFEKLFIKYVEDSGMFELIYAYLDVGDDPIINISWEINNKFNTYDLFTNKGYKNSYGLIIEIKDKDGNLITDFVELVTLKIKVPFDSDSALFSIVDKDDLIEMVLEEEDGYLTISMSSIQGDYIYTEIVSYPKAYQVLYILMVVFVVSIAIAACIFCGIDMFRKNK